MNTSTACGSVFSDVCVDVCVKPVTLHGTAHAHMDERESSRPSTICWCTLPSRESRSSSEPATCMYSVPNIIVIEFIIHVQL